jgi:hypothetical protein
VSDEDIRQYDEFRAKMKADASAAGAGSFSFDQKKDAEEPVSVDDLYK